MILPGGDHGAQLRTIITTCGSQAHFAHNHVMRISVITPASTAVWNGNRVTAERWAGMLKSLGHGVRVEYELSDPSCDLLIALHARKSATAIGRFAGVQPERPIIVALTGTDVYGDLHSSPESLASLEAATRIVVLQPAAVSELPVRLRGRTWVIYQSVSPPREIPGKMDGVFEVCVIGNLRKEKDPFRAAEAAKLLPATSRIRILHIGAALDSGMKHRALQETEASDRYEWLGPLRHEDAMRRLGGSHVMALTSIMEGGANVVAEAVVCGVPVISSRIPGSIGLLGEDYPGFFPVGDTQALAQSLYRAETETTYYESLVARVDHLRPLFDPSLERVTWRHLLEDLSANFGST